MKVMLTVCRMELRSILIPLASSQRNLHGIYLLLCIQY